MRKQMILDFVDAKIESLEDYLDNLRPEEERLRDAPEYDLIMFKEIEETLESDINDCDFCIHHNPLMHFGEGLFYQCMMGNKMWKKCTDFEFVEQTPVRNSVNGLKYLYDDTVRKTVYDEENGIIRMNKKDWIDFKESLMKNR